MQERIRTITITGALLALSAMIAPNATACSIPGVSSWRPPMIIPQGLGPLASLAGTSEPAGAVGAGQTAGSIVGLWYITFVSDGYIVDQAFDVWHSDGTEVLNDYTNPIEGNVCLGVWKQNGGTYKLKHPSWAFDDTGKLLGTAIIGETVTLDAGSDSFSGTYSIDLFDTSGNPVGKYHGTVTAARVLPN
ncbi:MAG TPA: hypothetical protein VMG35_15240 [Bryobacteraceae bacterium]|nr:hypothetical protein [Bryobacteraceae bacterium]